MNFKSTALLFGLLLGLLWLFGLMLAAKKGTADEMLVLPDMQNLGVTIDTVKVQRKENEKKPEEFDFFKENKKWRLQQSPLKYTVKVDDFKVDDISRQIRDARRDDEADVKDDPEFYGLTSPTITVTLKGTIEKAGGAKTEDETATKITREWKFFVGKSSPDKNFVYVNTSERPHKVYAVRRSTLDSLFFKDASAFRPKTLLDVNENTARYLDLKGKDGEVEFQKNEDATWRFLKPNYGLADFEGKPAPPNKFAVTPPKQETTGGIKALLSAINSIRVNADADFVPLGEGDMDSYGLEEGKETLRIQVGTPGDKKDDINKSTLLVGFKVKDKDQYYVRLADDKGVDKIDAKTLEPVLEALRHPGELRSRDLIPLDTKNVDAVEIRAGKDLATVLKFRGPEGKNWDLYAGTEKHKADDKTMQALIDILRGKGEVKEFFDEPEPKKKDAERGLDKPAAEVVIYKEAIAKDEKEKTDEKSKTEKEDKKTEKKDEKPADVATSLKKDAKPLATLTFGKVEGDIVYVKRTTQDGTDSRLAVPKTVLDKILPKEGIIAFFDTALPPFDIAQVAQLEIDRKGEKTIVVKGAGEHAARWLLKNRKDYAGKNFADTAQVNGILLALGHLNVQKWVKKLDAKEDLDKYGLAKPELIVSVTIAKDQVTPASLAGLLLTAPAMPGIRPLLAAGLFMSKTREEVVFKFGKEASEKDGAGVYATRSGSEYLFEVQPAIVKNAREADLRDRSWLTQLQPVLDTAFAGMMASPAALANLTLPIPLITGGVLQFDPAKVKEIKAAVRTPIELRSFAFHWNAKDKTWEDKSGLQEFHVDAENVKKLVTWLSDLHAERFIFLSGGPREEQKLSPKDAALKIEILLDDGRSFALTVGAAFEGKGYFAVSSTWPEVVFTVANERVERMLQGVGYFGKPRVALR